MSNSPIYTIEVCYDCLAMHANGETGGSTPDCEPWGLWEDELVTMGGAKCYCTEGEKYEGLCNDDITELSWFPCEGCGSTLGGYRHTFTVWD